jgi:hypothetical protein
MTPATSTILLHRLRVASDRRRFEPRRGGRVRIGRRRAIGPDIDLPRHEIAGCPRTTGRRCFRGVAPHEGPRRRQSSIAEVGRTGCGRSNSGYGRRGRLCRPSPGHLLGPAGGGCIRAIRRRRTLALARVAVLPSTPGTGRQGDSFRAAGQIPATDAFGACRGSGRAGSRRRHDHRAALTQATSGRTEESRVSRASADQGLWRAPRGAISHDHV